jgi:uncharacterized protein (TIGR03435 family)
MTTRPIRRSSLTATSLLLAASFTAVPLPFSQTTPAPDAPYTPTFTFDVATIRENPPSDSYTMMGSSPPRSSKFSNTSITAKNLITLAYGLNYYQTSGGPDWLDRARFNIQAKSDPAVDEAMSKLTKEQASLEKRHMLQTLLADRFKLKVHQETKDLPAFALVIAKSGLKMQEAKPAPPNPDGTTPKLPAFYQKGDGRRGYQFIADGAAMPALIEALAGQFAATIVDKTGLTATYDFTLQYNGTVSPHEMEGVEPWPPLTTAIQDQLGLKLEPTKAPTQILVIDHIERPTEN